MTYPRIPAELLSLLDALEGPRILMDGNYRVLAANAAYRREFGGRNVIGRTCYAVSHGYARPCDRMGESCPLQAARANGRPQRVLHLHQTPHGEAHVDVELVPLRNRDGEIAYFMETLRTLRAPRETGEPAMVGQSPAFTRTLALLQRVAPSSTPVLLLGPSGAGKELAAQTLHQSGPRRDRPFVPVDCSGMTESLFESELFGYEKGAFTGAHNRKIGLVEAAAGGTLFLDEVGDIPLSLQVKLLRLLETGTYRRVGGIEVLRADFRLVSATHRDLKAMVAEGGFRQDLYYRIAAFPILLPGLRERIADLSLLAGRLLAHIAPGRNLKLHARSLALLQRYDFPGNVRELRNILERASVLADGEWILPEHLPEEVLAAVPAQEDSGAPARIKTLAEAEKDYLRWCVAHHRGDRKSLARALGISERSLYRKLLG